MGAPSGQLCVLLTCYFHFQTLPYFPAPQVSGSFGIFPDSILKSTASPWNPPLHFWITTSQSQSQLHFNYHLLVVSGGDIGPRRAEAFLVWSWLFPQHPKSTWHSLGDCWVFLEEQEEIGSLLSPLVTSNHLAENSGEWSQKELVALKQFQLLPAWRAWNEEPNLCPHFSNNSS